MQSLINDFLQECRLLRASSSHTLSSYKTDLSAYVHYIESLGLTVVTVNSAAVRTYLGVLQQFAPATRARKVSVLRQFYHFLWLQGQVTIQWFSEVTSKSPPRSIKRFMGIAEVKLLLGEVHEPISDSCQESYLLSTAVELLYAGGLRVSEAVALTYSQLLVDSKVVRLQGKGQKERLVPLYPAIIHRLLTIQAYQKAKKTGHNQLFFAHLQGTTWVPLTRFKVYQFLKNQSRLLGLAPVTPHDLRHAFASHLYQQGLNLRELQLLLGHSSLQTTEIYTHIPDSTLTQLMQGFKWWESSK